MNLLLRKAFRKEGNIDLAGAATFTASNTADYKRAKPTISLGA